MKFNCKTGTPPTHSPNPPPPPTNTDEGCKLLHSAITWFFEMVVKWKESSSGAIRELQSDENKEVTCRFRWLQTSCDRLKKKTAHIY